MGRQERRWRIGAPAAVGVANEGGKASPAAQQSGATSDGTTTDDQTSGITGDTDLDVSPEQRTTTPEAGEPTQQMDSVPAGAEPTEELPTAEGPTEELPTGQRPTDEAPTEELPAEETTAEEPLVEAAEAAKTTEAEVPSTPREAAKVAPAAEEGTEPGGEKAGSPAAVAASNGAMANTADPEHAKAKTHAPELHSGHKLARRYQPRGVRHPPRRLQQLARGRREAAPRRRRPRAARRPPARPPGAGRGPLRRPARRPALRPGPRRRRGGRPGLRHPRVAARRHPAHRAAHRRAPGAARGVPARQPGLPGAWPPPTARAWPICGSTPARVLRTVMGQYRIRGLAVDRGTARCDRDQPQRHDTEAIGALLYASLTQRWPYEEDAHGLPGAAQGRRAGGARPGPGRRTPRPVRARDARPRQRRRDRLPPGAALRHPGGAGQGRRGHPAHPAAGAVPRRPISARLPAAAGAARRRRRPASRPRRPRRRPPCPGRTGKVLKWAVSALLIVALGLGSWQVADTLKPREPAPPAPRPGQKGSRSRRTWPRHPMKVVGAKDFDAGGRRQDDPGEWRTPYDGDAGTYWVTKTTRPGRLRQPQAGRRHHPRSREAPSSSVGVTVDFRTRATHHRRAACPHSSRHTGRATAFSGSTKIASGCTLTAR